MSTLAAGPRAKQSPAAAKVLVASDNVDDATQIVGQLQGQHQEVRASTTADLAVEDFEACRPDVLVLAFDSIDKAQQYSLGLYRQSSFVKQHRHRTVLLCTKDELRTAFDLCKKAVFDDYVLYWPLSHDGLRLAMGVWNAARETLALANAPNAKELLAHAEQLGAIDSLLQQALGEGDRHAAAATETLQQAETSVGAAIGALSRRLSPGRAGDDDAVTRELDRLKNEAVAPAFKASADGLAPMAAWTQQIKDRLEPHLSGLRGFVNKVRAARWIVLVIEDDEFARKLVAQALEAQDYEIVFAEDGVGALAVLRRTRPDLILMDINLPDTDGVALTAKLKAVPHLADIPILMVTGKAKRETLTNSMSAGAAGFIVKPFSREALIAKLERFLPART